jgi:hypothetical protein
VSYRRSFGFILGSVRQFDATLRWASSLLPEHVAYIFCFSSLLFQIASQQRHYTQKSGSFLHASPRKSVKHYRQVSVLFLVIALLAFADCRTCFKGIINVVVFCDRQDHLVSDDIETKQFQGESCHAVASMAGWSTELMKHTYTHKQTHKDT